MRARLPEEMLASPKLDPAAFKPYLFELEAIANSYYTGLQVNKDPGVPAVWAGCFLMVGGFLVTFFTSHRRFWIRLSPARAGTTVSVAATAGKNPVGLQRELEKLLQNLRSLWEGNH
jgi:cytochrome c biogenesis protein